MSKKDNGTARRLLLWILTELAASLDHRISLTLALMLENVGVQRKGSTNDSNQFTKVFYRFSNNLHDSSSYQILSSRCILKFCRRIGID